ncbi:MAG: ankyrin repeat domain-containing protein [Saprospiraceae bacterium]|nr:ankyrin repeat domain-containing protein [Saprospiraceae bacterium]
MTSRKDFIKKGLLFSAGISLAPNLVFSQNKGKATQLDSALVNEFVKTAHSDFDKVKEMLSEHPTLLNAAWDWGNGDFETALGAAGHVGNKEIANYLISLGENRHFCIDHAGKTDIVKAMLKTYPALLQSKGPHGFTLLHHAEKGGKDAEKLLRHVQKMGLTEKMIKTK